MKFDVLANGTVVGRIMKTRTPTHGYAATREAAMAAFVKSWRYGGELTARKP